MPITDYIRKRRPAAPPPSLWCRVAAALIVIAMIAVLFVLLGT